MSAILRVSGPDFDVDAFVANCNWDVSLVYHRGEALFPKTQPDGRKHAQSGLNVVVSDAGFHEFARQVEDAIAFLTEYALDVRKLVAYPGVADVVLDFGVAWRDVVAQSDKFPAELVRLAGDFGMALNLSHYPVSHDEPAAE